MSRRLRRRILYVCLAGLLGVVFRVPWHTSVNKTTAPPTGLSHSQHMEPVWGMLRIRQRLPLRIAVIGHGAQSWHFVTVVSLLERAIVLHSPSPTAAVHTASDESRAASCLEHDYCVLMLPAQALLSRSSQEAWESSNRSISWNRIHMVFASQPEVRDLELELLLSQRTPCLLLAADSQDSLLASPPKEWLAPTGDALVQRSADRDACFRYGAAWHASRLGLGMARRDIWSALAQRLPARKNATRAREQARKLGCNSIRMEWETRSLGRAAFASAAVFNTTTLESADAEHAAVADPLARHWQQYSWYGTGVQPIRPPVCDARLAWHAIRAQHNGVVQELAALATVLRERVVVHAAIVPQGLLENISTSMVSRERWRVPQASTLASLAPLTTRATASRKLTLTRDDVRNYPLYHEPWLHTDKGLQIYSRWKRLRCAPETDALRSHRYNTCVVFGGATHMTRKGTRAGDRRVLMRKLQCTWHRLAAGHDAAFSVGPSSVAKPLDVDRRGAKATHNGSVTSSKVAWYDVSWVHNPVVSTLPGVRHVFVIGSFFDEAYTKIVQFANRPPDFDLRCIFDSVLAALGYSRRCPERVAPLPRCEKSHFFLHPSFKNLDDLFPPAWLKRTVKSSNSLEQNKRIYGPSLGFYAVALAREMCSCVTLAGFDVNVLDPDATYGERPTGLRVRDQGHDFILERRLYQRWIGHSQNTTCEALSVSAESANKRRHKGRRRHSTVGPVRVRVLTHAPEPEYQTVTSCSGLRQRQPPVEHLQARRMKKALEQVPWEYEEDAWT